MTLPNDSSYVGEWKDALPHGRGALTSPNVSYVGEWKDGTQNGQGTLTSAVGVKYVGEFKDGKYHGQGTLSAPNGTTFSGYYMNDQYVPNICTGMGLREGTSEHGQCVLKLMETVLAEDD